MFLVLVLDFVNPRTVSMDPATLLGIPRAPEAPFLFSRTPWFRYRNVPFGPDSVGALLDIIICAEQPSNSRPSSPRYFRAQGEGEGQGGPVSSVDFQTFGDFRKYFKKYQSLHFQINNFEN